MHSWYVARLTQRSIEGDQVKETPIHMRDLQGDFAKAVFCESVEAGHSSLGTNARIAELLGMSKDKSVRMDSQAKYASIARGDGDVYLRLPVGDGTYQEKIWVRFVLAHARTTPQASCSSKRPAEKCRILPAVPSTLAVAARSAATAA